MSSARGDFFAVDSRVWPVVCSLGLNAAVAYLILARGTLRDQRTTSWSVDAIERRTRISRAKAKEAIARLLTEGVADKVRPRPVYRLKAADEVTGCKGALEALQKPAWTWLPNALIDGAAGEDPPVELLRQAQEINALRLLVSLYEAQDLVSFGGLHWRQIRLTFEGKELGRPDGWRVLRFTPTTDTAWGSAAFVTPFMTGRFTGKGPTRRTKVGTHSGTPGSCLRPSA